MELRYYEDPSNPQGKRSNSSYRSNYRSKTKGTSGSRRYNPQRGASSSQPEKDLKVEVGTLRSFKDQVYELEPIPTGVENLGKLFFFATQGEDGKPVLKPLGGFPKGAVINLGGTSDTGKSLLAEQFTVENALSRRVVFVTTESPKENLIASIKRISLVRGIPLEEIENKVIIVDLSKGANLDYRSILPRLSLLIERAKAEILVIDSLTAFFEDREMMARSVTRAIYRFAKERKLTTLLISQKREDSPFSARTAGGLAIGHIVDCNIVLSKLVITTPYERNLYGKEIGEVVRTLRIDGCRMCGHSSRTFIIEIDRYGILKVVGPLGKRVQRD